MSVACTENCACCRKREASASVWAFATGAGGGTAGGGGLPDGGEGAGLDDPPPPPQAATAAPVNSASATDAPAPPVSWAPSSAGEFVAASVSRSSVVMHPPGSGEPTPWVPGEERGVVPSGA